MVSQPSGRQTPLRQVLGTHFNDCMLLARSASFEVIGYEQLAQGRRIVVRSRALAGDRTRDLLITSPTPPTLTLPTLTLNSNFFRTNIAQFVTRK